MPLKFRNFENTKWKALIAWLATFPVKQNMGSIDVKMKEIVENDTFQQINHGRFTRLNH